MVGMRFLKAACVLGETYAHMRLASKSRTPLASIKRSWAKEMLKLLNVELTVTGLPLQTSPAIFVGNHISYLDIVLLMAVVPDITFVAKRELGDWPLFGEAARKAGTVFVDRSSLGSRMRVRATLRDALLEAPRPVAIFPSGTTSLSEQVPWKRGAFRIAQETESPLQAFRLSYTPLRKAAFIDNDLFPLHLLGACGPGVIKASIEFAAPELVSDPEEACARWRAWCQEAIAFTPRALSKNQGSIRSA